MKKLLAICLSVLLICAAMPFAFATAAEEATLVVSGATGKAGDTIDVVISLKNNPGLVSAALKLGYDSSVLELVKKPVAGESYPASSFSFSKTLDVNPYSINFCNAVADEDYTAEEFVTLTFKIKDDAVAGTYALTVACDYEGDWYNLNWDVIEFAEEIGSITVEGEAAPCEHEYLSDCDPICGLCGESRPVHTEGLVHIDAVDADCHRIGNIEYWYCPKCEMFWADEALTQLTNAKNVIVPALGSENVEHFEAKEPTCDTLGNIEYWYCADCDQYWQDAALTQLTNSKNVMIGTEAHNIVHIDAVAPGCHYIGNIEYWYCSVCGSFWQDEALTQVTNSKNVILPALGSENVKHVEAVAPDCYTVGNIEYWFCSDCEQFWQDEALTQLTNSKNVILGTTEHNIVHMDAVEPGCHYIGNIEYWYCSVCGSHWQDEALTQITNSKSVIVPAKGGDVIAFEAIEPACHYNGRIAYWYCPECEQFWQDEALTQITNSKNVILPATGSENLQHVEAKDPTCLETGNIEYWYCADCDQYWQNEALTQLTNSKNVLIAPVDHNIVHMDAVEAGCHYIGNIEYWYCADCGSHWQDEALTQITNSKNVIVPAKGGDVIAFEAIEPACHYNGRIAYWYCPECEQFWQDEALTQLTNSKNVILPATGSDKLQHVEAKEPTATENGNIEYWFCPECEQFWQDEALTQLTNSKNVIIAATGETPDSPVTGDTIVPVMVALLTLIASGVAVSVLKGKKNA